MAYDRKKVLTFGAAGIAMAALLILAFMPARKEVGIDPMVALQEIPGYGFQTLKISEEQSSVLHLYVTLDGFEVRLAEGGWAGIEVSGGRVSFDVNGAREVSFAAEAGGLDVGSYDAIRFRVVRGLEFTNATLDDGVIVGVDVPEIKVEFTVSTFEIGEGTESLMIKIRTGPGVLSNYILPQYHVTLGTLRLEFAISPA